jgi:hypothetical protein
MSMTNVCDEMKRTHYIYAMQKLYAVLMIVVLVSCMLFSCTWESMQGEVTTEPTTYVPLSYYPVYPGSWWLYEVNDTTTEQVEVSSTYLPHRYVNAPGNGSGMDSYSDTTYVPFLNGKPIYGYNKIAWVAPPFGDYYVQWPILSEEVGFEFERDWTDKRFGDFSEKVKVTSKYFNGTDSIITLEGHWVYGPNVSHKSYQTYAKNIGLTFSVIVDTVSTDTLYKKVLSDYFINQ